MNYGDKGEQIEEIREYIFKESSKDTKEVNKTNQNERTLMETRKKTKVKKVYNQVHCAIKLKGPLVVCFKSKYITKQYLLRPQDMDIKLS